MFKAIYFLKLIFGFTGRRSFTEKQANHCQPTGKHRKKN